MDWTQLLSRDRLGGKSITPVDNVRTVFEADFDRIAFCGAFRRLSRKTQVHPFADDHVHTRLTHSLEVARVGRSLGKGAGLALLRQQKVPDGITRDTAQDMASIVAAACLGHDLGNPPFGHAGEDAMAHSFRRAQPFLKKGLTEDEARDLEMFEGNAQGFRMITQTENHLFTGGLRLTYATLGTFLKYPWTSTVAHSLGKKKFGSFLTESAVLDDVAQQVGLVKLETGAWCRHPLAHLVEAADDICYATLDLEDAVEMKILPFDEAKVILLRALAPDVRKEVENDLLSDDQFRVNFTRMRGPVFTALIMAGVEAFMRKYEEIMAGTFAGDLFSALPKEDPRRDVVREGKEKAAANIYPTRRKVEIELGCYAIFECLLEAHLEAAVECVTELEDPERKTSPKSVLLLRLLGNHKPTKTNIPPNQIKWTRYTCMRRMMDYVSGMTDNYANNLAAKLRGNFTDLS